MKKSPVYLLAILFSLGGFIHAQEGNPPGEKPATVKPPETPPIVPPSSTAPAENKPAPAVATPEKKPEIPPGGETKISAEEEAKLKLQKEQVEKEAAAKLAAQKKAQEEEAARKREEEKGFLTKFFENSKIYTGLTGGLGIPLNSVHGVGFGFGMTFDLMAYKHYGLHFGAETGQYKTKALSLTSGNTTLGIPDGGAYGYLAVDLAAVYGLPKFLDLEPAVGLGGVIYRVAGGTYEFNTMIAPRAMASLYYNLLSQLQVGLLFNVTLASASKLLYGGTEYVLDKSSGLTTMGLQLNVRYAWF